METFSRSGVLFRSLAYDALVSSGGGLGVIGRTESGCAASMLLTVDSWGEGAAEGDGGGQSESDMSITDDIVVAVVIALV